MWNERLGYSLNRMLITGEAWNERVGYSLSRMLITGENEERESGSLSANILITGQNVERESGLLSEQDVNPLNAELNPICHLLALLEGATTRIVVVSRLRVKHGKGCGTREWATLWPPHNLTRVRQVIITIFFQMWMSSVILQV